jgi:hypothetical protein
MFDPALIAPFVVACFFKVWHSGNRSADELVTLYLFSIA